MDIIILCCKCKNRKVCIITSDCLCIPEHTVFVRNSCYVILLRCSSLNSNRLILPHWIIYFCNRVCCSSSSSYKVECNSLHITYKVSTFGISCITKEMVEAVILLNVISICIVIIVTGCTKLWRSIIKINFYSFF